MAELKNLVVKGARAKVKVPMQSIGFQVKKSDVDKLKIKYLDINVNGTMKNLFHSLLLEK